MSLYFGGRGGALIAVVVVSDDEIASVDTEVFCWRRIFDNESMAAWRPVLKVPLFHNSRMK